MKAKNGIETLANSLSTKVRVYLPRLTYFDKAFIVGTHEGIYAINTDGKINRLGKADQIDWDTVGKRIRNLKSLPYTILIAIRDLL